MGAMNMMMMVMVMVMMNICGHHVNENISGQADLRFLGAKLKSNMQKVPARDYTPP
jgi:hypothetical protein